MTAQAFPLPQALVRPAARPQKKAAPKRRSVAGPRNAFLGPRTLHPALDRAVSPRRRRESAEQRGSAAQAQELTWEPYGRALLVRQLGGGSLPEVPHGRAEDPRY